MGIEPWWAELTFKGELWGEPRVARRTLSGMTEHLGHMAVVWLPLKPHQSRLYMFFFPDFWKNLHNEKML